MTFKALPLLAAVAIPCFASPAAAQVNARENNQEQRIIQGERSGELTRGEAGHLQRQQSRIDSEVARDRAVNGGKLTATERAQVARQQNRASQNVYDKKHNEIAR